MLTAERRHEDSSANAFAGEYWVASAIEIAEKIYFQQSSPNGGVDRAARNQAPFAESGLMREALPPLRFNDLLCSVRNKRAPEN